MNARMVVQVRKEVVRIQNTLGTTFRGNKVRAVTAVARNLLLQGPYFCNGKRCDPKVKSIGAGVYEIWLEDD